jgi:hypothetical protein
VGAFALAEGGAGGLRALLASLFGSPLGGLCGSHPQDSLELALLWAPYYDGSSL